jgi:hypothetical protein
MSTLGPKSVKSIAQMHDVQTNRRSQSYSRSIVRSFLTDDHLCQSASSRHSSALCQTVSVAPERKCVRV